MAAAQQLVGDVDLVVRALDRRHPAHHDLVAVPPSTPVGTGTLTVSVIHGGVASNIVPEWCTMAVGRRLAPGEDPLAEFERISARGGVLGAMETQYQRGKIQDESMLYEMRKHSGELPIIGVNTFLNPDAENLIADKVELRRATPEEKAEQIAHVRALQQKNAGEIAASLDKLKGVALAGGNVFAQLMETARVASLGQITQALYEVGGQYRRNM